MSLPRSILPRPVRGKLLMNSMTFGEFLLIFPGNLQQDAPNRFADALGGGVTILGGDNGDLAAIGGGIRLIEVRAYSSITLLATCRDC